MPYRYAAFHLDEDFDVQSVQITDGPTIFEGEKVTLPNTVVDRVVRGRFEGRAMAMTLDTLQNLEDEYMAAALRLVERGVALEFVKGANRG